MEFVASDEVRRIKSRLDHPIIDSDGHAIEYLPLVRDILKEQAGEDAVAALDRTTGGAAAMRGLAPEQMRGAGMIRISWWGLPARNTLDRATALLPALLAARVEEMGIDHAILYPTYGLGSAQQEDADLRRADRARVQHVLFGGVPGARRVAHAGRASSRCTRADEAIAELEFATSQLGLKAFMFGGPISRPVPGLDAPLRVARWLDTLGVDSVYDYDPVWAKCVELGVSPTFHTASMGWPTHSSVSSYVYNHIGMFATAGETLARSLFLGGVPPSLPHAPLRVPGRWRRMGGVALRVADLPLGEAQPRRDRSLRPVHARPRAPRRSLRAVRQRGVPRSTRRARRRAPATEPSRRGPGHDRRVRGVGGARAPRTSATPTPTQFHFGCEADDPMTALAFDARRNPLGARLRAIFASDVGHWDVPDVREVLPEAWELVERRARHRGRLPGADVRESGVALGVEQSTPSSRARASRAPLPTNSTWPRQLPGPDTSTHPARSLSATWRGERE